MAGPHTRFYLDKQNKKVAGVCAGIADFWGVDVTLVRIGAVVSPFIIGPLIILAYFMFAWLSPVKPGSLREAERHPEEKKFWQDVRKNPRMTARNVRARFREIDRRLADVETYLTSPDRRLAREIDELR